MGRKLLGGAVGVLGLASDAVRHAAWYLRYRVDGTAREGTLRASESDRRS